MPRNGSGVYGLPATYEATAGETILAEQHNDPLEDLEQDANTVRPIVAGGTGVDTAIEAHDAFSTKGANVASATTTDIGAATGQFIHITGTTTITGLGTATAGIVRRLVFDGALTLTHNATSLILPGGANITTAAGDSAIMVSEGGGNWRCLTYVKATGLPIIGGGKGTAIASATTISIGSEAFYHITGTTTITDIDFTVAGDGRWAILEFDGILTLTHNGTTLTLPGARNITTAAGDRAFIVQDSGDNVHVLFYQPYIAMAPYITPWVAYTPTFSASFGTVTSISAFSRRVGDTLQVRAKFTVGTVTAAEARVNLGFNGTDGNVNSDATKVASLQLAGNVIRGSTAAAIAIYALIESNVAYLTFGAQSASRAGLAKVNGDAVCATGETISLIAEVPISGW